MPPSKRRQIVDDDDDDDDEEAYESPPKRQAAAEKDEDADEEMEAAESGEDGNVVKSPIKKINAAGKPPEAGIIKQVYVENFMCHRKLRVDLCKNVNFIHGQNGSGKSAILAAIQICLGAGARRTNRARNLKELVRKEVANAAGPAQAKIRVTLLNQGGDGYKPEIYGDSITVERTISLRGGYNGYKLLDCQGVEKSRNKKDLDEMIDVLNIQVENPVAILDQEEAKKFLTGKSSDKYNFFMKATELERVNRTFALACDHLIELQTSSEKAKDVLSTKIDQVAILKKKWEQHEALEKFQQKVAELNVSYAWAYFNATEEEYNKALDAKTQFEEKAAKKQAELTQAEEAANTPNDDEATKKQRMDDLVTEAQEQAMLKRQLEADLKKAQAPYKQYERELQKLKRDQKAAGRELIQAKKRLQEMRDQIAEKSGSAESEQARRTAALKETEDELAKAKEQVQTLKQAVSNALRSYEELEPHVLDARSKADNIGRQLQGAKNTLRELESSSSDSMAILGPRVSRVHQLVEKAKGGRKFKDEVIGPIGAFIKIAHGKEPYASIAELAIGNGVLDRFIVFNHEDRQVLQQIRQKVGCAQDCGIFQCQKAARFRVPGPPSPDVETVASALNISNDLVFNCLVDNARIDQKALTKGKDMSEKSLLTNRDGKLAIKGIIKEVYCLPEGDMWKVNSGSQSMISNSKKLRNTIGADRTAAIAHAQREIAQLTTEHKELRKEEARLDGQHTEQQRAWNIAKRAMQTNDSKITDLDAKIDELKGQMDTIANDVTFDTTELEEEVTQAEQNVQELSGRDQHFKDEMVQLEPEIAELQGRLEDTVTRNEKVLEEMKAAEEDMTRFLDTQTQKEAIIEKKRRKLEQYKSATAKHQERVDVLGADKDGALLKARKLEYRLQVRKKIAEEEAEGATTTPESPSELLAEPSLEDLEKIEPKQMPKDTDYYEAKIARAKSKVEKERERRKVSNEDPAVAIEKYQRAKKDLEATTKQSDELEAKISEISNDIAKRKKRWRQFRRELDKLANVKFDEMLGINKYSGNLDFDHENNSLDLLVQKDASNSETTTKDVKSLSGGERSFTTMCLLLALGETLETPFRILDEFDVFLDPQVRKLVIQSLIFVAKKMEHRQFIFITPQDLSSLTPDPQLKILKLTPPARYNSQVGGPSQQTLNFSQTED